jgi:hypothetical protein
MRRLNGKNYLRIGEVAKKIERGTLTIKSWYDWHSQQPDSVKAEYPLPEIHKLDDRGTRYFEESDINKLVVFRDKIAYGTMAEFNRPRWGNRGKK